MFLGREAGLRFTTRTWPLNRAEVPLSATCVAGPPGFGLKQQAQATSSYHYICGAISFFGQIITLFPCLISKETGQARPGLVWSGLIRPRPRPGPPRPSYFRSIGLVAS